MLVALYNRTFDHDNLTVIQHVITLLDKQGMRLVFFKDFYERVKPYLQINQSPQFFTSRKDLPKSTEMIFSLGGDGTLLDAVTFVGDSGIPIVGVNLGRLGFLAAISEHDLEDSFSALEKGSYSTEQRSLIHLEANVPLFGESPFALNEFTLHRKDSSSMVKIHTYLNGEFLNTYWADGLIVATPTGSTGYSLSCGGPVVFPQAASFVITPVAPHNLNTRPIVVPDDNVISFEIEGRSSQFLCTLDSRTETVDSRIKLAVRKEAFSITLLRPNEHNFLSTIRQKLYWGIDHRN